MGVVMVDEIVWVLVNITDLLFILLSWVDMSVSIPEVSEIVKIIDEVAGVPLCSITTLSMFLCIPRGSS